MHLERKNFSENVAAKIKAGWLSLLIGVLLCTFVAMLWWSLYQRELTGLHNMLNAEAEYLASHVDTDLRMRIPTLQRITRRWELRGSLAKDEFINDAGAYLADFPGLLSVQWVDRDLFVRWIVPLEGNERVLNMKSAFDQKRRIALEQAKDTRFQKATAAIDLMQGGKGFLIYFPIYVRGEFDGFILGVFPFNTWLDTVFLIGSHHHIREDFRIAVFMDDVEVLKQTEWDALRKSGLEGVGHTKILDKRLSINIRPTPAFIAKNKTLLPELAAFFGVLLSILVAFIVYLFQKAYRETRQIKAAEEALKETEEKFRVLSESTPTAILLFQDDRWIYANPAAQSISGYRLQELLTMNFWDIVHPDYRQIIQERGKERQKSEAAVNEYEIKIIARDGSEKWIQVSAASTRMNGRPAGIVSMTDITLRKSTQEALRLSEEQVRLLLNSTGEAIYGIDLQGNCNFANPSCLNMLGYVDMGQVLGKNMHWLIHHSYPDGRLMPVEICRIFKAFRDGKGVHVDDEVLWRADGSSFPIEYWSYPQIVDDKVIGAVVTFVDITKRRQMEEALATERQRLASILEGTNVGTWEWNVQTGETIFNQRWAGIIGYTIEELEPVSIDTWMKFAHPDDLEVSKGLLERHFRKELPYYECEARMRHKDGSWVWVLDRGKVAAWTDDGKPLVMSGTHQDITERKLAEMKIQHMANHDGLTDLPSLRLANDRLSMVLGMSRRQKKEGAVMFIDLDGFKAVNDTLGHDAGDHVLKQVAERLLSCVRETDTVARVGGDEFLLVAYGLNIPEDAILIAEKILRSVSQPVIFNGREAVVGASIGIALFPDHGEDKDQLIKLADEAMYTVKKSGKNRYSFAGPAE